MSEKWGRIKCQVTSFVSKLFCCYKVYLLVFFAVFLIFFVTGILTCANYISAMSCEDLIDNNIYIFLCHDSGFINIFLMHSLFFVCICLFVMLFTRNIFFNVVDVIILALISYIFGFDICIIVCLLGIAGVIFGVLVWGLFGILIVTTIILIMSVAFKRVKERKHALGFFENKDYIRLYLLLCVVGEIIVFLQCFLFSLIQLFVIV